MCFKHADIWLQIKEIAIKLSKSYIVHSWDWCSGHIWAKETINIDIKCSANINVIKLRIFQVEKGDAGKQLAEGQHNRHDQPNALAIKKEENERAGRKH